MAAMPGKSKSRTEPKESADQLSEGLRHFSRKKQRKMDRKLKKVKKLAWYTHKKLDEVAPVKRRLENSKRKELSEVDRGAQAAKRLRAQQKQEEKAQKRVEDLKEKIKQKRIQKLEEENEAESRLIKKLEKQLHLNKRKNKSVAPASFANDGLDYILEVLENPQSEMGQMGEDSEETEAIADEMDITLEDGQDGADFDHLDEDSMNGDPDEDSGDEMEDLESNAESVGEADSASSTVEPAPLREDIYGRIRDSAGNVVRSETGKYIPPARKAVEGDSEDQIRLVRQLKGLLNRLTEKTMASIVSQVEQLFAAHSRHDMNETVTNAVFTACITNSIMPKRFALEHGLFMGLLYQNIGAETGAFYLQRLLKQYDKLVLGNYAADEGKRLDNLLLLWCQAYNFKILHASMIFEILSECSTRFTEKDIALIVLILREVRFTLHKGDPAGLKELIAKIQAKTTEKHAADSANGFRVNFMLDILTGIKNNNMKKIPNYEPSELDHLMNVFEALKHKGRATETPLKISLADLRMASEHGKWWVVGAAWNRPDLPASEDSGKKATSASLTASFNAKLLDLAVKQRMNTDVRKAVFCAVMSAEDYNEAFYNVMKLALQKAQEADIFHVLVHCGLNEARFNPFYSLVLEKFCQTHRTYQRLFLFVLWDKIRDLSSLSPVQQKNLSHMVAHGLTHNSALPITVLKKINFAEMNAAMVQFLRLVLSSLLLTPSDTEIKDIFSLLADKKYRSFRERLRLFLRYFMTRHSKEVLKGDFAKFSESFLTGRIDVAEKALLGGYNL